MKILLTGLNERYRVNLIACFGRARLLARFDGRAELRGGSDSERTEAKEWISLFLHEAVLHDQHRSKCKSSLLSLPPRETENPRRCPPPSTRLRVL
jgi:hypothetical protein